MTPEEMKTLTTAVVNELKALVAMEVASVTPPDHPLDALAAHIRLMTIREERAHYADMHRRAQHEKILTAMVTNLDVILPMLASGWMRWMGDKSGPSDNVTEYTLLSDFLRSLRSEQFVEIGSILPMRLRSGFMAIYNGDIVAPLIPAAAAKLLDHVDEPMSVAIYELLDPSTKDEKGEDVQSAQQLAWARLWRLRENTLGRTGKRVAEDAGR